MRFHLSFSECIFFLAGARCLSTGHHLRLTRGPAGNRTTTGSLSVSPRTTPYQLSRGDTFSFSECNETICDAIQGINFDFHWSSPLSANEKKTEFWWYSYGPMVSHAMHTTSMLCKGAHVSIWVCLLGATLQRLRFPTSLPGLSMALGDILDSGVVGLTSYLLFRENFNTHCGRNLETCAALYRWCPWVWQ